MNEIYDSLDSERAMKLRENEQRMQAQASALADEARATIDRSRACDESGRAARRMSDASSLWLNNPLRGVTVVTATVARG